MHTFTHKHKKYHTIHNFKMLTLSTLLYLADLIIYYRNKHTQLVSSTVKDIFLFEKEVFSPNTLQNTLSKLSMDQSVNQQSINMQQNFLSSIC